MDRLVEENKALVRRYIDEVWNKANIAAAAEFLAPDYHRYLSPSAAPLSFDGQKQRLTGFRAAFPDVQITIESMIAEGAQVSFRGTLHGTHQGTFLGIAPTGKAISVAVTDFVRLENGLVVEHWGGPDLMDLLQQLGAAVQ